MGSLLSFFTLTFVLSWSCWMAVVAMPPAPSGLLALLRSALLLIGTFAPALIAVLLTYLADGGPGLYALLGRIGRWNVRLCWYLFAVAFMPMVKAATALSHRLLTGSWPRFGPEGPLIIAAAIVLSTPVQSGEEVGWRGFALPRLASRIGLAPASVLLGVIWGIWHLPFFYIAGADQYRQSVLVFVLGVTALSVAMAWLFVKTGGSLLLTMLMHSAVNQVVGVVSDVLRPGEKPFVLGASLDFILTVAWMWLAAGYLLVRMWRQNRLLRETQEAKTAALP